MKKNILIQKILSAQPNQLVANPSKKTPSKQSGLVSTNVQGLQPRLEEEWNVLRKSLYETTGATLGHIQDICIMLATISPVDVQLSNIEHMAVQQIIYETISIAVTKIPTLENISGVLPITGNIYMLINYLEPMTQFGVMQQLSLSAKDYKKLMQDIIKDLKNMVAQTKTTLQQYIAKMIKQAPEIVHASGSTFAEKLISWKTWNAMGYTQLKPKKKPPGRKREVKQGKWSCKKACKYLKNKNNKLNEIANFEVDGSSNEVLLFHGSGGVAKSSLQKSIDWKRGGGYLGKGFYMTFNPNEAKIYACRAANETNSANGLVLEIVIKNANQFLQKDGSYWRSSTPGHFCRNDRDDVGGWWDQINVRDDIISNMEIRRIHIIPRKSLKHYGSTANPNNGGGNYTVQRKKNDGVYCKK